MIYENRHICRTHKSMKSPSASQISFTSFNDANQKLLFFYQKTLPLLTDNFKDIIAHPDKIDVIKVPVGNMLMCRGVSVLLSKTEVNNIHLKMRQI